MAKGGHICLIVAVLFVTMENLPKVLGSTNQIVKYAYSNNGLGTYSFEFKTSDGTYRKEEGGFLRTKGNNGLIVRGEYGYLDPSGRNHIVRYIADTNGFQPEIDEQNIRFNDRRII
ncbi:unnamed protein product [Parnassius apollo]|uniref:(apollo) hypothetical protein n=1 Tax=Parnassius apollo TaxID=110799 RepID=A0A8S3XT90_PARAO|nr:unnamed protein product [Parnassius apollo]